MLEPILAAALNRVLRRNSWAQERLKAHSGKTVAFEFPPFTAALTVLESGELAAAAAQIRPETTIRITPGIALRIAARDETVWNELEVRGDTDFATAVNQVWRNLDWDIEEDLAQIFGDLTAHRVVETGKSLEKWRAQSLDHLLRSFAEYWTEEDPLIVRADEVEEFNREVDRLRDDVARFEKRLDLLAARWKS
jgi:ubiquinone biosynthesis protein UbiJ